MCREFKDEIDASHTQQLPYQAGWQDIKDLFRHAGAVVRADINVGIDGRAKGSGTVVFDTAKDAQNAISACSSHSPTHWPVNIVLMSEVDMYNGFEWYGRMLEVREVRIHSIPSPFPQLS